MHIRFIVLVALVGCSGSAVSATESGPLAQFDLAALHGGADTPTPSGDVTQKRARCTFVWPDDADQGFEVLVEANYTGAVPSSTSITTVRSDCALAANVDAPARYLEVGGVNDTRLTLRLSYTCPSGEGSSGVTVSSIDGVEMGGSTMSCVQEN